MIDCRTSKRICKNCKKEFEPHTSNNSARYCSRDCFFEKVYGVFKEGMNPECIKTNCVSCGEFLKNTEEKYVIHGNYCPKCSARAFQIVSARGLINMCQRTINAAKSRINTRKEKQFDRQQLERQTELLPLFEKDLKELIDKCPQYCEKFQFISIK